MQSIAVFTYQRQPKRRKKKLHFKGELIKEKREQIHAITMERYIIFFSLVISVVLGTIVQLFVIKQTPQIITFFSGYIAHLYPYVQQQVIETLPKLKPLPLLNVIINVSLAFSIWCIQTLRLGSIHLAKVLLYGTGAIVDILQFSMITTINYIVSASVYIWNTWISALVLIFQTGIALGELLGTSLAVSAMFVYGFVLHIVTLYVQTIDTLGNDIAWIFMAITQFIIHTILLIVETILTIILAIWYGLISLLIVIKRNIDAVFAAIGAFFQPAIPVVQFIIAGTRKSIVDLFTAIHTTFSAFSH